MSAELPDVAVVEARYRDPSSMTALLARLPERMRAAVVPRCLEGHVPGG